MAERKTLWELTLKDNFLFAAVMSEIKTAILDIFQSFSTLPFLGFLAVMYCDKAV